MTSKFKREMEMLNPYHFNTTSVFLSQDYSRQMFQMFIEICVMNNTTFSLKIFKSATTTVQQQQYHFEVMMYK